MKKLILSFVTIAMFSCAPKQNYDNNVATTVNTEYTLDECISNTNTILSEQHGMNFQEQSAKNSEQIMENQIVIMKSLKKLDK